MIMFDFYCFEPSPERTAEMPHPAYPLDVPPAEVFMFKVLTHSPTTDLRSSWHRPQRVIGSAEEPRGCRDQKFSLRRSEQDSKGLLCVMAPSG